MSKITVIKLNLEGHETWRYQGVILERGENYILLEARFNWKQDVEFRGIKLKIGDRFVEIFYANRWYNIFEIHDRHDDRLKGWYCNIGMPATISEDTVSYRDFALDMIVLPDGSQTVVDEDEFAALALSPTQREGAQNALKELQGMFLEGKIPSPLRKMSD
jgi:protein associated with RNAse G/E